MCSRASSRAALRSGAAHRRAAVTSRTCRPSRRRRAVPRCPTPTGAGSTPAGGTRPPPDGAKGFAVVVNSADTSVFQTEEAGSMPADRSAAHHHAPVAQSEQSATLRTSRSQVRVLVGALAEVRQRPRLRDAHVAQRPGHRIVDAATAGSSPVASATRRRPRRRHRMRGARRPHLIWDQDAPRSTRGHPTRHRQPVPRSPRRGGWCSASVQRNGYRRTRPCCPTEQATRPPRVGPASNPGPGASEHHHARWSSRHGRRVLIAETDSCRGHARLRTAGRAARHRIADPRSGTRSPRAFDPRALRARRGGMAVRAALGRHTRPPPSPAGPVMSEGVVRRREHPVHIGKARVPVLARAPDRHPRWW